MSTISCDKSCGPSDFCEGGKCDLNGCYTPISTELHNIITARSKIEYPAKKNQGPFTTYQQWARKGFAKCAHWLLNDTEILKLSGWVKKEDADKLSEQLESIEYFLDEYNYEAGKSVTAALAKYKTKYK